MTPAHHVAQAQLYAQNYPYQAQAPLQPLGTRRCRGCGKPLPADAPINQRHHDANCRSRARNPQRVAAVTAARRARIAAQRQAAGRRVCEAPGCEVDISDRSLQAVTCSPACRIRRLRHLHKQAAQKPAQS